MKHPLLLASLALLAVPAGAAAQRQALPAGPPPTYSALLQCRTIAAAAERLACFDRAAAAMQTATQNRDLVVVDREQIRKTRRSLFGLAIPNLGLFGNDERDEDEVKTMEGEVASVGSDENSRYIIRLKDGSTWRQIDGNTLGRRPRPGFKVVINRTVTGSYMMRVEGQPGIRVKRTV